MIGFPNSLKRSSCVNNLVFASTIQLHLVILVGESHNFRYLIARVCSIESQSISCLVTCQLAQSQSAMVSASLMTSSRVGGLIAGIQTGSGMVGVVGVAGALGIRITGLHCICLWELFAV